MLPCRLLGVPAANRASSRLLLAAVAATLAFLSSCAVTSEPTARHAVTPQPIKDLSVRQQGDAAIFSFTLPTQSTDQQPLPSTPTVEIYRAAPQSSGQPTKPAARPTDTIPGTTVDTYKKDDHIEFPDPLDPAALASNPGQQVTFTVRTRVSAKAASADSNAVTLPLYPAPGAVRDLRAMVSESAINLAWAAPAQSANSPPVFAYRVYRAEVAPPNGTPASPFPKQTPLQLMGEVMQPAYPDTDFQLDHAYSYVVRSVAQFGSHLIESADSTAPVFAKDVFPPAVPQGLRAIVMPVAAGMPAYVELVWAISSELDLAGYNVYRGEQPGAPGTKMTPELLGTPTFQDVTVTPGTRYYYRVTAVDRDGNESPASTEVDAAIPPG